MMVSETSVCPLGAEPHCSMIQRSPVAQPQLHHTPWNTSPFMTDEPVVRRTPDRGAFRQKAWQATARMRQTVVSRVTTSIVSTLCATLRETALADPSSPVQWRASGRFWPTSQMGS